MAGGLLAGAAAVAAGAVLGAWLRWGLAAALNGLTPRLPLGTLVANVAGGLVIGALLAWFARHPEIAPQWRLLAVTGFLGALTTFSTFSAESLTLIQRGEIGWAAAHTALHVALSVGAAGIGYRLLS